MITTPDLLNHEQIQHKIKRIAYQIYETFASENHIVIAGIAANGYIFAQRIAEVLAEISPIEVTLCEVRLNKKDPFAPVTTSLQPDAYSGKGLVLVDDVLQTGTTLIYGVRHFLNIPLKKFKTAVLVDRNHKKYPIKADFKGISLSTSMLEHVTVAFDEGNYRAYLT